jgi:hypothetical protein
MPVDHFNAIVYVAYNFLLMNSELTKIAANKKFAIFNYYF